MGSADPPGKWMKNYKAKTCKKEQFSMFMLYFESNQGRQVQSDTPSMGNVLLYEVLGNESRHPLNI